MDLLLILTYSAICIAIFKIFRIPINKWTVPTAVLGGIGIVGALIFGMNYNHPYSEISRQYFVSTPIIPNVNGQVIEVPVKVNAPLKAGDILFKIDPTPFKHKVDSLKAQLRLATEELSRAEQLVAKQAMPERNLDITQSRFDQVKADLAAAQYDLEQTIVRAPTDGFVTQVAVRPGMRATSLPFKPLMIFIPLESHRFIGWFRQNSLLRLKAGDEAEITLDGVPGMIFHAKVSHVFAVMAEGQIAPSGELIDASQSPNPGRVPVMIEIDDPEFEKYIQSLPGGVFGQSAIYTHHAKHLSVMRKVLIRMIAWMNYLFPFH